MRSLTPPGTWHPFGQALELNQASNVNSLALGGTRLFVSAGNNGQAFFCDPGDADFTVTNLDNLGLHPAVSAKSSAWTGTGWVVGTNRFFFRSAAGQEPWVVTDAGLGSLVWTTFATLERHLVAAFDTPLAAVIRDSDDDGATWQNEETFDGAFVFHLAASGGTVYAARADGLWKRAPGSISVGGEPAPGRLRFALAGPQPFGDRTRVRFELPVAGSAAIDVYDVSGRAVRDRIAGSWSAGSHEVELDARGLAPGVYMAVLSAGGIRDVVRLVHER